MNKLILFGAVAAILVIGSILYLLGASSPEKEYSTTPTKWSQEGDYKIEETPEGTVVTNEPAGFSFRSPAGWKVKGGSFGDIYSLDLISPDATLRNDVFLESGCLVGVEAQSNRDFVRDISETIGMLVDNPSLYPDKEVVEIKDRGALKTTAIDKGELYSRVVSVEVPLKEDVLLVIGLTERSPSPEACNQGFDLILESFVF